MNIRVKKPTKIIMLPCLVEHRIGGVWLACRRAVTGDTHYRCVKVYGNATNPTLGVGEIAEIHIDNLSICSHTIELSN
jgi:hypothetical protein